jgi:hypothetical protein
METKNCLVNSAKLKKKLELKISSVKSESRQCCFSNEKAENNSHLFQISTFQRILTSKLDVYLSIK